MPTLPTNYTITSVTYNNVEEDSIVYLIHPTAVLVISPLNGYFLDYTEFSLEYPPIYTTSAVFTQSGANVILTLTFDTGFVMPDEDVDIPLCINGAGQLLNFRVTGSVIYTALTNAYVDSGVNPFTFDTSNNYNTDVIVYNETIIADPGYFFSVAPTLRQVSGDPTNFDIAHTDYFDINDNIVSREYSINYLTPNYDSLGNTFNLKAIASEIYVPTSDITSYSISNTSMPLIGGLSTLIIYGGAGANWELTCASPILQTGPRDPITGLIPYGTTTSGVLDSSGQFTVGISVGVSLVDAFYSILLEGDLSAGFAQQNPIFLYQFGEILLSPFDYIIVTYEYNVPTNPPLPAPQIVYDYDLDTISTLKYPSSTITGATSATIAGFIPDTGVVGCGTGNAGDDAVVPSGTTINTAYLVFGGDDAGQSVAGSFGESVVINFKNLEDSGILDPDENIIIVELYAGWHSQKEDGILVPTEPYPINIKYETFIGGDITNYVLPPIPPGTPTNRYISDGTPSDPATNSAPITVISGVCNAGVTGIDPKRKMGSITYNRTTKVALITFESYP